MSADGAAALHAAVVGGSGFTGGELCRLLLGHPNIERISPTSRDDMPFERRHRNLMGSGLEFRSPGDVVADASVDVAFFCTPTGEAMRLAPALLDRGVAVVDLSADFRFPSPELFERAHGKKHTAVDTLTRAVYGLTEQNRAAIVGARLVANPGCYVMATCLALAPLLAVDAVDSAQTASIFAVNGMSGAASEPRRGIMHTDVFGSMLPYNLSGHRHAWEIEMQLERVAGRSVPVDFTTAHGNFVRGIYLQAAVPLGDAVRASLDRTAALELYVRHYGRGGAGERFVRVNDFMASGALNEKEYDIYPAVKDIVGSNFCHLGVDVDRRAGRAKVVAVIDNLVKGAAGSAIQNMNLMLGLPEGAGLASYGV